MRSESRTKGAELVLIEVRVILILDVEPVTAERFSSRPKASCRKGVRGSEEEAREFAREKSNFGLAGSGRKSRTEKWPAIKRLSQHYRTLR